MILGMENVAARFRGRGAILVLLGALALLTTARPAQATPVKGFTMQLILSSSAPALPDSLDCSVTSCDVSGIAQFSTAYVAVAVNRGYFGNITGFLGAYYGVSESSGGSAVVHTGFTISPHFILAPGTNAPSQVGVTATVGCRPLCTVIGYHSYLVTNAATPVTFQIVAHADPGIANIDIVTCPPFAQVHAFCGGVGVLNGSPPAGCQCWTVPAEPSTWGALKTLYD